MLVIRSPIHGINVIKATAAGTLSGSLPEHGQNSSWKGLDPVDFPTILGLPSRSASHSLDPQRSSKLLKIFMVLEGARQW